MALEKPRFSSQLLKLTGWLSANYSLLDQQSHMVVVGKMAGESNSATLSL